MTGTTLDHDQDRTVGSDRVTLATAPADVLERLRGLRAGDAPVRGGRVLSYVYDPGMPELDELTEQVLVEVAHLNGLDPLTFGSIATLEAELTATVRDLLGGGATGAPDDVVGTVTSGGTESTLLAVWTARVLHPDRRRILAPTTVHPATVKAAHYLGLELELVPCDPDTGTVEVDRFVDRLADDVVLAVVSAPSYPYASLDPVAGIAAACADRGIDLHVDACLGGLALPLWPDPLPVWDFRVPGVTSIAADLHKYGYATKGASVLLHRGRDRQRAQFFADTQWPGYPVVTGTTLGSRSVTGIAVAWAQLTALGIDGLTVLMRRCATARTAIEAAVADIDGLRVVGHPAGPLLALTADETVGADRVVHPHLLVDALGEHGWYAQAQPALRQSDGTVLPRSAHLTLTPVIGSAVDHLVAGLRSAADAVRGATPPDVTSVAADLVAAAGGPEAAARIDAATAAMLLERLGLGGRAPVGPITGLMALIEELPAELSQRLLVEVLARRLEPLP